MDADLDVERFPPRAGWDGDGDGDGEWCARWCDEEMR